MAVDIANIKRLKELTGVGLTDAKAALEEVKGDFDKALEATPLKLNDLPSFARLCINVILVEGKSIAERITSKRQGYIIGSVSVPIFSGEDN